MLQLKGVGRMYSDHRVFKGVSLELSGGERLALIGENGSGKSSLLRLIAGLESPDEGVVTCAGRVAYLPQQASDQTGDVLSAVTPLALRVAAAQWQRAGAALTQPTPQHLEAYAAAEEHYRALGGYEFEVRALAVLGGLHLEAQASAAQLSGGQTRRLLLARLLLAPAELYLLDEPTNHLDEESVRWLERWVRTSRAAFIMASHDRAFLDAAATRTAELERGELYLYCGNYSAAMQDKARKRQAQQRDYAAYQRKRAALNAERGRLRSAGHSADTFNQRRAGNVPLIAAKNKAQDVANTLASRARALERRLERLDTSATPKPFDDRRLITLELPAAAPGPSEVLRLRHVAVWRGDKCVLADLNLEVRRGEKVVLRGPNGGGKSTLLSAIVGQWPGGFRCAVTHSGEIKLGAGAQLYFAAQGHEELRGLHTLKDALLDANPLLSPHQLHEVAAQMGLPAQPDLPLLSLSGGQRTRLTLARLSVTRAQLLILDEPTNHLDIKAIEALEDVLRSFPGTLLLATHDRRLSHNVATRLWDVGEQAVRDTVV